MGLGSATYLSGLALLLFSPIAHTRAMKMKEQSRFAAEYFWYAGGLLPLAGACVFLASNGDLPVTPQRFLLFAIGALVGGSFLLGLGESIRPTNASSGPSNDKQLERTSGEYQRRRQCRFDWPNRRNNSAYCSDKSTCAPGVANS